MVITSPIGTTRDTEYRFKGIDFASENGYSLIVALDCGIKSVEKSTVCNPAEMSILLFVTTTYP